PFIIPAHSRTGITKLKAGLWAFEKLGGVPKDRRHETWSAAKLAQKEPAVDVSDLAGAVVYPEYLTDDARLTLANVRSAAAAGAMALNYAPVLEILTVSGKAVGALVGDALSPGEPRARIAARVVVNAAGPWVDAIRAL